MSISNRNPGPEDSEWPRYTKENPVYYIYDAVNVGLGKGPRAEACEFWNGLMPEIKAFVGKYETYTTECKDNFQRKRECHQNR